MMELWRITPSQNIRVKLGAASLDEATRQLPDGYYSTFRTFAGGTRVLGLSAHLRRLYDPVPAPEVDETSLRRQLRALLELFHPDEARVRAVMTRQGQVYVAITPLILLPPEIYESGVRVVTTGLKREHPRLKSTSFISRSESEREHLAQEGIFEALLVRDGKILEGMTSNFFSVKYYRAERALRLHSPSADSAQREVTLYTARDDVLPGITRETVIAVARDRGLAVKYQPLEVEQLMEIDEAFITSSSRGVVPVIQIDNVRIGQGSPGPVTKQLISAYEEFILQKAENI